MKGGKILGRLSSLGLLTVLSIQAYAAGFKLEFQSASTLADAGDAAVVEDAGTNWYNSAGLVYLPMQIVGSSIDLYQATTFSGNTFAPSLVPAFNYSAGGRVSSHTNSFLPSFHLNFPFWDRYALGLSVAPAWGLAEDYGENTILRYSLTRIYTRTIDIAPSLAVKINEHWSIGAGYDAHYMYISSRAKSRTEPLTPADSITRFSGSNWNYGAHIGVLYRVNDAMRIGLNYRTKILQNIDGFSDFVIGGTGPTVGDRNFQLPLSLPPTTTLSLYKDVNPCWALMGTIAYDQWSVLRNFHGFNIATPVGIIPSLNEPEHLSNTVDVSVGTRYRWNEKWLLRGSLKYVGNPTQNAFRSVNFPDGEKFGINLGTRYTMNKSFAFDFIIAHVFTATEAIHDVNPLTLATAIGRSRTSLDLIGAQVVWSV